MAELNWDVHRLLKHLEALAGGLDGVDAEVVREAARQLRAPITERTPHAELYKAFEAYHDTVLQLPVGEWGRAEKVAFEAFRRALQDIAI